jgi:outer membrane protein OmpA-like peptidoglycan-associated protein
MRILITGSLVFLLWAIFSSWLYVSKIKPAFNVPAESAIIADTTSIKPSPPVVVEAPIPIANGTETLILYFEYNKAELNTTSQNDQQSSLFLDWLGKHPDAVLNITGHTDSKGSDAYNQSLGMKRAENTKKYFSGKGISPEKIVIDSKGEKQPVSDNTTEDGRTKNRRTEITLK